MPENPRSSCAPGQPPACNPPDPATLVSDDGDGDSVPCVVRHRRYRSTGQFAPVPDSDPTPLLPFDWQDA